jgi:hypothetical protein
VGKRGKDYVSVADKLIRELKEYDDKDKAKVKEEGALEEINKMGAHDLLVELSKEANTVVNEGISESKFEAVDEDDNLSEDMDDDLSVFKDSSSEESGVISEENDKKLGKLKEPPKETVNNSKPNKTKPTIIELGEDKPDDDKKKKSKNENSLFSASAGKTTKTTDTIKTTWDMESIMSDITDITLDDFDADLEGYEYEGFDPSRTLEILAAYAEEAGITQDEFKKDMMFFAPFIAMRGTNKKSIVERTKSEFRGLIEGLLKRYKVQENSNKGGHVSKDTIILSRIVSCFPTYVSMALVKRKIPAKCPTDGLPIYLHHTAGAALIPKSDLGTYNLWLSWSKKHDKLINGRDADERKVEAFGKIIHESTSVSEELRAKISAIYSKIDPISKEDDKNDY